ncbi:hypothetical protein O166_21030 [Pseudogulbenkiania ferrooxidans EGD-HP2]|uniref:Uncharacterized protein n=1 Tax=Pseudogulbenkiania ferrooxidans EGD-HP2 TaxID=1388764 RepID=A0ABN0NBJ1_9NEIS|nr:hypothetical protein O166_21030 [Pseudogulbenkiania ferrooxidans EGD-HP2]
MMFGMAGLPAGQARGLRGQPPGTPRPPLRPRVPALKSEGKALANSARANVARLKHAPA